MRNTQLRDRIPTPGGTRLLVLFALAIGPACPGDDAPVTTVAGSSTGDDSSTGGNVTVNPTSPTSPGTMGGTDSSTSNVDTTMGMPTGGGVCGDDTIDDGEDCDGADLGGEDCTTQGFLGGDLACAADCTLDVSGCVDMICGDGTIQGDEQCDTDDLGGNDCVSIGRGDEGELGCNEDCTYDLSACINWACGNDILEGMEVCDGADLSGEDCLTQGFDGGTLGCDPACTAYDTSGCYACGDDMIGGPEICDGADLGGEDCTTQGFDGGVLGCAVDCTGFDTSGCFSCGDGVINGAESCDGADLGGESCGTQGFAFGTLACDAACAFDTSGCGSSVCSTPGLPIGPGAGVLTVDTIAVPPLSDFVTDVNVYVDASHTWAADMDIDVRHIESDTQRRLIADQCGSDDDLLATFDMDMGLPVDCALPSPVGQGGFLLPQESLEAYSGIPAAASTWELTILDDASGDGGTLNEWCVEFEVGPNPLVCGDGLVMFGEGCDDGNLINGDGCDDTCSVEFAFTCSGEPSICVPCPPDPFALRLTELDIGTPDYVELTNTGLCPIDVAGLNIFFDDSSFTDLDFVLPSFVLDAGQSVLVNETAGPGDIDTTNIFFDVSRGGAAILCTGVCTGAADVIDVVAFSEGEVFAPLPPGVSFNPAGLTGWAAGLVYGRVAFAGVTPAFLAADWAVQ